jgi:hypothetical protein
LDSSKHKKRLEHDSFSTPSSSSVFKKKRKIPLAAMAMAGPASPMPMLSVVGTVPLPVPPGTDALYTFSIASSPDGAAIAVACSDQLIHVLNRSTFQPMGV